MKKNVIRMTVAAAILATSGLANAGSCGYGYIKRINVGGWNSQNLHIILEHTRNTQTPTTSHNGWLRFTSDTPVDKFKSIKAMAYLALANGNEVYVQSATNNCAQATEIDLYRVPPAAS